MKHINRIFLVAFAILAPLAALADIAPTPPPGYREFLFSRGYFDDSTVEMSSGLPMPLVFMATVFLGLSVVFLLLSSKRKRIVKIAFRTVSFSLLMAVGLLSCHIVLFHVASEAQERANVAKIVTKGYGEFAPEMNYKDSASHRKEYDKYCMEQYEKLSCGDFNGYHILQSAPLPREDAPDKVKESYKKLRDRAWADYTEHQQRQHADRFGGGE